MGILKKNKGTFLHKMLTILLSGGNMFWLLHRSSYKCQVEIIFPVYSTFELLVTHSQIQIPGRNNIFSDFLNLIYI